MKNREIKRAHNSPGSLLPRRGAHCLRTGKPKERRRALCASPDRGKGCSHVAFHRANPVQAKKKDEKRKQEPGRRIRSRAWTNEQLPPPRAPVKTRAVRASGGRHTFTHQTTTRPGQSERRRQFAASLISCVVQPFASGARPCGPRGRKHVHTPAEISELAKECRVGKAARQLLEARHEVLYVMFVSRPAPGRIDGSPWDPRIRQRLLGGAEHFERQLEAGPALCSGPPCLARVLGHAGHERDDVDE